MPTRMVREGILTSERVNALSTNAELFYRRLMNVVDDFGRYSANPTLLRASCYPLKLDSVKEDSISKHLAECVGARLIVLYTVEGKSYLELVDFRQQVRAKESRYPAQPIQLLNGCVADAKQTLSTCEASAHLGGDVDVDEDGGGESGAAPAEPSPPAILIPVTGGKEAPVPQSAVLEFQSLYPGVNVADELRKMRGWAVANPAKRKTAGGLLRFVNNWLARAQDEGGTRRQPAPHAAASRASMQDL